MWILDGRSSATERPVGCGRSRAAGRVRPSTPGSALLRAMPLPPSHGGYAQASRAMLRRAEVVDGHIMRGARATTALGSGVCRSYPRMYRWQQRAWREDETPQPEGMPNVADPRERQLGDLPPSEEPIHPSFDVVSGGVEDPAHQSGPSARAWEGVEHGLATQEATNICRRTVQDASDAVPAPAADVWRHDDG